MLIFSPDEQTAGQVAMAIELWKREARRLGISVAPGIDQVRDAMLARARVGSVTVTEGQDGSILATFGEVSQGADMPTGPLLTLDEAAERLGVSRSTLKRLTAAGEIRTVRVGRRAVRFHADDLDAYIAGRRTATDRRPGPVVPPTTRFKAGGAS